MTDEYAIRAEGLAKRFGDTVAVDGIDLAVPRGSVYGFLGPNGAGKTTTRRMLTTLTRPSAGTASVDGTPVTDRDGVRGSVGYLPEEPPVFDELTGREQLQYFARLRDIPAETAAARIDRWLDRFDLADEADRRIDDYSKGMRGKVGLIQALLHEPPVLFLDEPTSGLDPRAARTVLDVIADLADAGRTVFLSTHILPVVEELADSVGVLSNGSLVAEGPPAELTARLEGEPDPTLEDVFLSVTAEREATDETEAGPGRGSPAGRVPADERESAGDR